MIHQIAAHASQLDARSNAEPAELSPWPDPGQHEDLWRVDGAGAKDDFAGAMRHLPLALPEILDPGGAAA